MRSILARESTSVLEPDVLTPAQWGARHGGGRVLTPERKLMLAVLESALDDFRTYYRVTATSPRGVPVVRYARGLSPEEHQARETAWAWNRRRAQQPTIVAEVMAWVNAVDDCSPFAFTACCEQLGLDADYVREGFGQLARGERQVGGRARPPDRDTTRKVVVT